MTNDPAGTTLMSIGRYGKGGGVEILNAPILAYQFDPSEPKAFAELSRVTLPAAVRTDDDAEVAAGTSGTVVGVWPGAAAYEVDFPLGLATVEASLLIAGR